MPTILVVDDDSNTCSNMTDLFSDLGYSVESAQEAESALAKARSRNYDVGLVDLRMPGMDGLTLCRHLKQLHPRMVTMIVTAYIGEDLCREAAAIGVRDVVTKPVDFPRLLALVERALVPGGESRPDDVTDGSGVAT